MVCVEIGGRGKVTRLQKMWAEMRHARQVASRSDVRSNERGAGKLGLAGADTGRVK